MQKKSKVKIVLDAWALLSLIFKEEPAAGRVKHILSKEEMPDSSIYMSWINAGEVYYSIGRRKGLDIAEEILNDIKNLPVVLHEPSKTDILAAATLKSKYKLSYADAFAVSLAQKIDGTIVTGDPEIILLQDFVKTEELSKR
jgi:ribonuclease VapC